MNTDPHPRFPAAPAARPIAWTCALVTMILTALATAKEPAAAPEGKGDLVQVEAFDAGLVRRELAHKTFSPDGKQFAGYYRDGWDELISIHDAATGKQIKRFQCHGDEVVEFKFTPDGKTLASRCVNRGRVGWALWDVASGKLLMRLPTAETAEEPEKAAAERPGRGAKVIAVAEGVNLPDEIVALVAKNAKVKDLAISRVTQKAGDMLEVMTGSFSDARGEVFQVARIAGEWKLLSQSAWVE